VALSMAFDVWDDNRWPHRGQWALHPGFSVDTSTIRSQQWQATFSEDMVLNGHCLWPLC